MGGVQALLSEQFEFVNWWDGQDKDPGGDNDPLNRSVNGYSKLESFNLKPMVVSRWVMS